MFTTATYAAPFVIITLVFCSMVLVSEGLPIRRREHGNGDLIAGEAFLSMLMGQRQRSRYREAAFTRSTTTASSTTPETTTATTTTTEPTTPPEAIRDAYSSPQQHETRTFVSDNGGDRVSSVDFSRRQSSDLFVFDSTTEVETTTGSNAILSEERPSLIAEANKSELGVEESEPITRDYEALPSPQSLSVIYQHHNHNHNHNPANRARSVSYSTVIQSLPNQYEKKNLSESVAETKDYYVTSKYNPPDYNESHEKRHYETTERNWGIPERSYAPKQYTPIVYAQPEQNYEVDEAVSVETNGRAHGVQQPKEKKKDDNQKVGYVVEGRNYRKYRVEERTSDGFIVGEYGVVSHDDGSLRGVRYTADGTINPRLIYDALMKFLAL